MTTRTRAHRPLAPGRAVRGLTLIELLLTLVIFSLVIGVFSQALFQVAQFERRFDGNTMRWQTTWNTGFALDGVFDRVQLLPETRGTDVKGGERQFEATGVSDLPGQEGVVVRWVMQLKPAAGQAGAAVANPAWGLWLKVQPLQETGAASLASAQEREVARWPGKVRFEFVDMKGAGSTVWPPLGALATPNAYDAEALPSAVRVVSSEGRLMHAWAVKAPAQRSALQRNTGAPTSGADGQLTVYGN